MTLPPEIREAARWNPAAQVPREKTCTKCHVPKEASMFSKASREKDGLQDWCLACSSKANSERRKILRLELGPDSVLAKKVDHGSEALVWCGLCKTNLPPSCFGLRAGKCKACASRQAKESRERKIAADLLLPATTPRKCSCCGEVKTIKDFHSGLYRCKS